MALADGGELIILAPGLKRFGEQPEVDAIIRKYGYCGTPKVMENYRRDPILQDFAHATAHLIHGSSEGRFTITYAPGHMSKAEIESVNFRYADLDETLKKYPPDQAERGIQRPAQRRTGIFHTHSFGGAMGDTGKTLRPSQRI